MPRFPAPALRLLLRDGTGTLEATLAGSDALLFLFGSPRLCEAPASPGQPAAPSQLGSDLTPLLDRLTGACSTTYVRIGGEGGESEERGFSGVKLAGAKHRAWVWTIQDQAEGLQGNKANPLPLHALPPPRPPIYSSSRECGVWSVMNLQAFVRADGARRYRITDTRLTAR